MTNSDTICNLIRKVKTPNELFIGATTYNWTYMIASYTADCTEALPLSIFDKTICGILHIDGAISFETLGDILGFNVKDDPENFAFRDGAEYSLLYNAIQSLVAFNMVEHDADGNLRLTEIGQEYYLKGKKFRITNAKPFKVYLDTTAGNHALAKDAFEGVMARSIPSVVPPYCKEESFLKTFIGEQLPDIYDTEKGNSFTNVLCDATGNGFTVLVDVAALYDVLSHKTRYIAFVNDELNGPLTEIIEGNEKMRETLGIQLRARMHTNVALPQDQELQASFEKKIADAPATAEGIKSVTALIPSVMEPEEFWQALPLLIGTNEKKVFLHTTRVDAPLQKAITALAEQRPDTAFFLSYSTSDNILPDKKNLFLLGGPRKWDFLCCTEGITYALRAYPVQIEGEQTFAQMVFRYQEAREDCDKIRAEFAKELLPRLYTDTLNFLDRDFEPTRKWVNAITYCDSHIAVFSDFLSDEFKDRLRKKKQETLNSVKLAYEKTLVEQATALLASINLDSIEDIAQIDEIREKFAAILKDTDGSYITLQETVKPIMDALREREMYIREEKMAKYFIIDTNVFLDDPDILSKIPRRDHVVVAAMVIKELDKMKLKSADPDRASNARKAVRALKDQIKKDKTSRRKFLELRTADMSLLHQEFREEKGDNYILGVAVQYRDKNPFLITSDNIFSLAAEVEQIPTMTLQEFYEKIAGKDTGAAPASPVTEAGGKTYLDIYDELYNKRGYVIVPSYKKALQQAGLTPSALGYGSYETFLAAAPEFSLSNDKKSGQTYVNKKH